MWSPIRVAECTGDDGRKTVAKITNIGQIGEKVAINEDDGKRFKRFSSIILLFLCDHLRERRFLDRVSLCDLMDADVYLELRVSLW